MALTPNLTPRALKTAVFIAALMPLAWMIWDAFNGGLGANPVEELSRRTGHWALRLLLVTLAVTPLRRFSGWNPLARVRRMLGLFTFFYVCIHLTIYLVLDASLDPANILDDVVKRRYLTVGFATFLMLLPLAITSTDAMQHRLGGRRWRRLHRLAYFSAGGGLLHFLWLIKADYSRPLLYLTVAAVLLGLRLPWLASRLARIQPTRRLKEWRAPPLARRA